ncbi:hypothetical protein AGMMS50267_14970 [Spirochaetia bacterium]|nr:hypothetical protein AGMMS50267_14970 [Spirochaetia bacterium]
MLPKVSILTPAYNCAHLIHRLLDSVLIQTYSNIEMFVIDDGSTDNTQQIIAVYKTRFNERGYQLEYVWQQNQGQSVAINNGLKLIQGEYLVWPDADDFYAEPDAIEALVQALDSAPEDVGLARSFQYLVDEDTLKIVGKYVASPAQRKTNLFEDCLFCQNGFWFTPGTFMVRTDKLFSVIPNREIFTAKEAGQNMQLLLPVLYNYNCITIEKYLYKVLFRPDSHSRIRTTCEESIYRDNIYLKTRISTLNNMKDFQNDKKDLLIKKLNDEYEMRAFRIVCSFGKHKEASKIYKSLKQKKSHLLTKKMTLIYYVSYVPFLISAYKYMVKVLKLRR